MDIVPAHVVLVVHLRSKRCKSQKYNTYHTYQQFINILNSISPESSKRPRVPSLYQAHQIQEQYRLHLLPRIRLNEQEDLRKHESSEEEVEVGGQAEYTACLELLVE